MSDNVEVVHKMYQCFRTGDMATLKAEVLAEDVVWHLPGHHPLAGVKHGVDEVLAFFGALRKLGAQVTPLGMGELSNGAVAEIYTASGDFEGTKLEAFNCNYYTIVDGKITEVHVLMGDQHNYDNFIWAGVKLKPLPDRLA